MSKRLKGYSVLSDSSLRRCRGASFFEALLAIPIIFGLFAVIGDIARQSYIQSAIKTELIERIRQAESDKRVLHDVWSHDGSAAGFIGFDSARKGLISPLKAFSSPFMFGVQFHTIVHNDVFLGGVVSSEAEGPVGYLPPGYTAYVPDWDKLIKNTHKCLLGSGAIATTPDNKLQQLERILEIGRGGSSFCGPNDAVKVASETLSALSRQFPTELVVFYDIKTLFGTKRQEVRIGGHTDNVAHFTAEPTITPTPSPTPTPRPCSADSRIIPHGSSVTYFSSSQGQCTFPDFNQMASQGLTWLSNSSEFHGQVGSSCQSEQRVCVDGTLQGTFTEASCNTPPTDQCLRDFDELFAAIIAALMPMNDGGDGGDGGGDGGGDCFDPTTKIALADGSTRAISELNTGDMILNPKTGKPSRIDHIGSRPESQLMVEFGFGASLLKVTAPHPIVTDQGVIKAIKLKVGTVVFDQSGKSHTVDKLRMYKAPKGQKVMQLVINSNSTKPEDHVVAAEGMMTGDNDLEVTLGKLGRDKVIDLEKTEGLPGGLPRDLKK